MIPFAKNPHFVGRQKEIQELEDLICARRAKEACHYWFGRCGEDPDRAGASLPHARQTSSMLDLLDPVHQLRGC
jgi:hypothetical protein